MRSLVLSLVLSLAFALTVPSVANAAPPGPSIVELAQAANGPGGDFEGLFDTLIAALLAADPSVIETLSGNGQFTVFAPTDDAFGNLGLNPDNIDTELSQSELTEILLYHVARGRRDSGDVTSSSQIRTLQRGFLQVDGTELTDNVGRTGNIIVPDVMAGNGIIHAIDEVVLPFLP